MKKYYLLILVLIAIEISSLNSFGQSWDWGVQGYGSLKSNIFGSSVATDKNGDAYITGQYETTLIIGNDTLREGDYNTFLVKYNSAGSAVWIRQPDDSGTSSLSLGVSVATDGFGNAIITGIFHGTIVFGTFTLRSNSIYGYDTYLVKYDSAGNVRWAEQSTLISKGSMYNQCNVFANTIDISGNSFVTGSFEDTISFGPNILESPFAFGVNVFLAKYDSMGNILWAKQSAIPSRSSNGTGYSVTTDKAGNSYITGNFTDTISFGTNALINNISADNYPAVFIVKFSPSGNILWAKQSINRSINSGGYGYSVITDPADNFYITGYFEDTVGFDSHILFSPGANSAFLIKYDSNGNTLWAQQSSPGWMGSCLATDKLNHIYLSGTRYSDIDSLAFGNYELHTEPWTAYAGYLMKFDTSGNPICGSMLDNLGYGSFITGVASDSAGIYVYLAGTFEDSLICANDTLIGKGIEENVFLGRWQSCDEVGGIAQINSSNPSVTLFPNPNNGVFTVALGHAELVSSAAADQPTIEVYNMLGEKVYFATLKQVQGDNRIDLTKQHNGIYLYRVIKETGELVGEGKVIIEK